MSFRIHHLSDVHFGSSSCRATNRSWIIPERTERNAKAYLAHLPKLGDDTFPDLVIISGDFATFAEEDEMNAATDFVTGILKTMRSKAKGPASAPKVMIVPGNHDVDWRKSTSEESHHRFARFANTVYNSGAVLASKYHQEPDRPICFDVGNDAGIFVYLFLRIGQNDSKVYLEDRVQKAIPAFHDMNHSERSRGLKRLRDEIGAGEVEQIRKSYIAKAEAKGDMGFIVARKPSLQPDLYFRAEQPAETEPR